MNEFEIIAVVNGKVVGTAGVEAAGTKHKVGIEPNLV